jgi:transketolase
MQECARIFLKKGVFMRVQKKNIHAVRMLAADAVQKANSGHPGMPMGMAEVAAVLWCGVMKHHPEQPNWMNRDRFVLSNGHGSMLLYALLHLTGYDVRIEDLKKFRQWGSRTPGHPERGVTPGVETTTGPLGQGLANAVGMAVAERLLGAQYNRPDHSIIDHFTYVFVGDGCLMEGISHEVASLAGSLKLGKLVVLYDDNGISIDGEVHAWFADDTPKRFEAYGWHVIPKIDGHDTKALAEALKGAKADGRPSLLCCQTEIGRGSPNKVNTASAHGSPLGEDELALVRQQLDWPYAPFELDDAVYADWDQRACGQVAYDAWFAAWAAYEKAHPDLAAALKPQYEGKLPKGFHEVLPALLKEAQALPAMATRKASLHWLNKVAASLPCLVGGSADLSCSNLTQWKDAVVQSAAQPEGRYLQYGVREFGMTAMANGIALHGGFLPYTGTFLVFSDYARNAIRLAAMMKLKQIFVYTHDSIGLGEDGPTHQPIEHLASLRVIPDLAVWRPCDAFETAVAWSASMQADGPSVLALSRQTPQKRNDAVAALAAKGGYVLHQTLDAEAPDALIIATGSEVSMAMEAAQRLEQEGMNLRVVSMPCVEVFRQQTADYQQRVVPDAVSLRCVVEAGVSDTWYAFATPNTTILALNSFGHSAPAATVYQKMGLTADAVVAAVQALARRLCIK